MPTGKKGTVYQRKDSPNWYARVYIAGRPRYKGGFQTKSAAQLWIDQEVATAERQEILGIEPIRGDVSIRGILKRWLASIRPRVAERTYETYESLATKILIPHFGDTPIEKIRRRDVDRFLAEKAKKGKAPATLNRYLSCLSRICQFAVDAGYARENPTRGVKRAREEPKSFTYLSREDEARLLAAMPDWLRTPSLVALDAGLRAGEIGALGRRDVDLNRGVIVIRRSKSNKPREVGMTERLKKTLKKHLKTVPKGADRIFTMPDGREFDRARYRYAFDHATKAADLDGFRFHDLRHCCGVRLAEAGATPAMIKAVLGHKSLAATMRYMDHAPLDAARTAARLLDAVSQPTNGQGGGASAKEEADSGPAA